MQKDIYRRIKKFSENMEAMLRVYGMLELEDAYKKFTVHCMTKIRTKQSSTDMFTGMAALTVFLKLLIQVMEDVFLYRRY